MDARLGRVEQGNLGDCRYVGNGVSELKIPVGPGFRIYIGRKGMQMIILLAGGHKGLQKKDIESAKRRWRDYLEREEDHGISFG